MRANVHIVAAALASLVFFGAGCTPTRTADVAPSSAAPNASSTTKRLDLHGQGLDRLPAYVTTMTDLEELDVSGNRLTGALPSEIGKLVHLKSLDASGNLMTGVPAEIGRLKELRTLNLSGNRLTGLPLELGQLTNLETLDLSGNAIAKQDLDAIRLGIPKAKIVQ